MNKLQVIYNGWGEHWTVGALAEEGAALLFEYSPEALARELELSPLRVPLRAPAYARGEAFFGGLPGFIADVLPIRKTTLRGIIKAVDANCDRLRQ